MGCLEGAVARRDRRGACEHRRLRLAQLLLVPECSTNGVASADSISSASTRLYSCYDGAEFIRIGESWFDFDFTLEGATELKLPQATRFDCRPVIAGFQQAVGVL
jgi:hypothetical protein